MWNFVSSFHFSHHTSQLWAWVAYRNQLLSFITAQYDEDDNDDDDSFSYSKLDILTDFTG